MKHYVVPPEKIGQMVESLEKRPAIGFDTETTDLDPYKGELRLLQFSGDGETAYIVDFRQLLQKQGDWWAIKTLLENERVVKIMHNGKFDAKWVKHHLGVEIRNVFDTYIGALIERRGDKTQRVGLEPCVERFLGRVMDKTEQKSDWSANELSEDQLAYAAGDVCVLPELMEAEIKRLEQLDLMGVTRLENDIVTAMAMVELNGFYLDEPSWRQQVVAARRQEAKLADELQDMLYAGSRQLGLFGRVEIDLGSWQQVSKALKSLGIKFDGNATNENAIGHLKDEHEVVDKLFEWRGSNKQLTSYGDNMLEYVSPATGRVHADFMQIEAPSGRMGCSRPNLQNIPADKTYRNCFRVQHPERRLVVADYSQIELRVLAELSGDKAMIEAFASGLDYHLATAAQVFNKKPEDVTPEERTFAKRVNFGAVYGIGIGKLSRLTGLDWDTTKAFLKKYFDALPGMDKWLKTSAYRTEKTRQAKTMSGRIGRWTHIDPNHEDPEQAQRNQGSLQRLGKNTPIQGTAADIFKRGLHLVHEDLRGSSAQIVNLVHDEYVIECDKKEAGSIGRRVKTLAEQAGHEYLTKIPCKVDVKILEEWEK